MRPTEATDTLVRSLRHARSLDLSKMFGSAIDVTISDYTNADRDHVEKVSIHAEHAEPIRVALIAALEAQLIERRARLVRDIASIDATNKES